jgi:hypothetical protein
MFKLIFFTATLTRKLSELKLTIIIKKRRRRRRRRRRRKTKIPCETSRSSLS